MLFEDESCLIGFLDVIVFKRFVKEVLVWNVSCIVEVILFNEWVFCMGEELGGFWVEGCDDCWLVVLLLWLIIFEWCFFFWFFFLREKIFIFLFSVVFENFIKFLVSWFRVCMIGILVFVLFESVFDMFLREWVFFFDDFFLVLLWMSFELDLEFSCIRLVL